MLMLDKRIKIIIFLMMLFWYNVKAQSNIDSLKKYVVFTFEVVHKNVKQKEYYYWIALQDSIARKNAFEVFPLYTDEYSKDVLDRCKAGKAIDIFAASTVTNFNFDTDYELEVKNLLSLISINKIKIQDYRRRWTQNGEEVNVSVYASPIIGRFCNCLQSHEDLTHGFKGLVYLPVMSFIYDNGFWASKNERVVKYVDYSYVEYSSHYPSNIHGNSNIRVKSKIQFF
jgi:hypothetical protein